MKRKILDNRRKNRDKKRPEKKIRSYRSVPALMMATGWDRASINRVRRSSELVIKNESNSEFTIDGWISVQ